MSHTRGGSGAGLSRANPFDAAGVLPSVCHREVKGCSACGRDHHVVFVRLDAPTPEGYTHAGVCPSAAAVVYLRRTLPGEE